MESRPGLGRLKPEMSMGRGRDRENGRNGWGRLEEDVWKAGGGELVGKERGRDRWKFNEIHRNSGVMKREGERERGGRERDGERERERERERGDQKKEVVNGANHSASRSQSE